MINRKPNPSTDLFDTFALREWNKWNIIKFKYTQPFVDGYRTNNSENNHRWRDLIARISTNSSWKYPFEMDIHDHDINELDILELRISTTHVHTGQPTDVVRRMSLPDYVSDCDAAAFLRSELIALMTHELDECLLLDNEQLTNPHENQ